jgi:hypothetical protein
MCTDSGRCRVGIRTAVVSKHSRFARRAGIFALSAPSLSTPFQCEISVAKFKATRVARAVFVIQKPRSLQGSNPKNRRCLRFKYSATSEDHRNALSRKVLQKTPVLAMAQAQTCHGSPQVHQSCVRTDLSTGRQHPTGVGIHRAGTLSEGTELRFSNHGEKTC